MGRLKTIWITRTRPGAVDSAAAWQAAGYAPIIAPLLDVTPPQNSPQKPDSSATLIFTSANGVLAYQSFDFSTHHAVITVGDKTALAARSAGFGDVLSADGQSEDVTALVRAVVPKNTKIVHCAGKHVRGSIIEDLQAAGYSAQRDLYYQSAPVTALPDVDLAALSYVALYSPLAAKTLAALSPDTSHMTAISLSPAIDAALGDQKFAAKYVSSSPHEAVMIALLLPQSPR
ncbi:uroporphyrinogen-III synthase [Litorimonas sp. RW-G-Af-16]|uniref:uroporphyrinogen-III synthase n=1 Tax=Litorimonas sp. RW-G-Af-16 TaxID=3241168 RepID=UPI00390C9004